MRFSHSSEIWAGYPELVPGVLHVEGITADVAVGGRIERYTAIADARLAGASEGELPEIQAWRRAFSRMGLKPTQYRCASEALLRRFKKERTLPQIHPLIDLCNAISLAFAVPVAVFDTARVQDFLEVRHADGRETYATFSGDTEQPDPREVIFADGAARAHARRWTNRQSAWSAVRPETRSVLIVAEAMHDGAAEDMADLTATVAAELGAVWGAEARTAILSRSEPRLEL